MVRNKLVLWLFCLLPFPASAATRSWTGTVSNLWSVGGNWIGGVAPVDGDALAFADGALNTTMTNDLTGLDVASISLSPIATSYNVSGNAITLASGLTSNACCAPITITWNVPTPARGDRNGHAQQSNAGGQSHGRPARDGPDVHHRFE